MREVIAVATLLFILAISGSEAGQGPGAKTCRPNLIESLVAGC